MNGALAVNSCARCRINAVDLTVRGERLCKDCFIKYVGSKVLKRTEASKIRGDFHDDDKNILIVSTLDVSSVCLLQVMQEMRRRRAQKRPRPGYNLHVLHIEDSTSGEPTAIERVKPIFEDYTYHSLALEDCFDLLPSLYPTLRSLLKLPLDEGLTNTQRFQTVFAAIKSETSRQDAFRVLSRRLACEYAKQGDFDSLIFSDSTTQLAQKVLSETVKGRGGSLPWLTTDHTLANGIPCFYLMQDLLDRELGHYSRLVEPSLVPLINLPPATASSLSSKDAAIDDAVGDYFASVEENFPSIVANVVKTASKMIAPDQSSMQICDFCGLPWDATSDDGTEAQTARAVVNSSNAGTASDHDLCLGCIRTLGLG